jgi:hypothetical protein
LQDAEGESRAHFHINFNHLPSVIEQLLSREVPPGNRRQRPSPLPGKDLVRKKIRRFRELPNRPAVVMDPRCKRSQLHPLARPQIDLQIEDIGQEQTQGCVRRTVRPADRQWMRPVYRRPVPIEEGKRRQPRRKL